jgi:hypothetical protein
MGRDFREILGERVGGRYPFLGQGERKMVAIDINCVI